nr:RNA-directed DNA polymerase, eukaryota [Tanacetum cinerariifolium]
NLEDATTVRKAISLVRQAIGSSPRENTEIARPESTKSDSVIEDRLHLHGVFVVQDMHEADQISIAGTSSTEQPPLKDKSMWFDQEKKIQKIVRIAKSLWIQGVPNHIYSLIDSNKTAKDLWDALAKHMLGFGYGEQDRKAAVLYEYEMFKASVGELLLDTYIRYLQVINGLKKCGYSKDNLLLWIFVQENMSRDVLTIGSTMRISLLYRGDYSQWVERFMNYLEEQTDGESMINCIKNDDQPLPLVTQVSIAETSSTEQPPLKDKFMWSDQEKKIQKIDRLARSLLIQGLPNDIYSLIATKLQKTYGILLLDICLVLNMENKIGKLRFCMREVALKVLYKRLYALEMCKSISVAEKMGHPSLSHSFRGMPRGGVEQENYSLLCSKFADLMLPNISDRWCWSLECSQEFSVKSSRILIDNTIFPKAKVPTR